jgi:hypothetical protein
MISFLLRQLEGVSDPAFSKNELLAISPDDFEDLKRRKILIYHRQSDDDWETVAWPRCQHGCSLYAEKLGERYQAFCLDHSEEGVEYVGEDDLIRWRFSSDALLRVIIEANGINGGQKQVEPPCTYLGHKIYGSHKIGFVFIPRTGYYRQLSLLGIRHLCDDDGLVLLTPVSAINEIPFESILHHERTIHVALAKALDRKTFVLPLDSLIRPLLPAPLQHPLLSISHTEEQEKDYETHKYLCHDRIHITGDVPAPRNNLVLINGKARNIPDGTFRLLLRLAIVLWENKGGWIAASALWGERLIPDPEKHQPFSRLREEIEEHLLVKDGRRLLENDGTKNYRLSTHPEFVTCDRAKLLNHSDQTTKRIARQWLRE